MPEGNRRAGAVPSDDLALGGIGPLELWAISAMLAISDRRSRGRVREAARTYSVENRPREYLKFDPRVCRPLLEKTRLEAQRLMVLLKSAAKTTTCDQSPQLWDEDGGESGTGRVDLGNHALNGGKQRRKVPVWTGCAKLCCGPPGPPLSVNSAGVAETTSIGGKSRPIFLRVDDTPGGRK